MLEVSQLLGHKSIATTMEYITTNLNSIKEEHIRLKAIGILNSIRELYKVEIRIKELALNVRSK